MTCRASKGKPHHYDIVIGPTADDDTTFCINNYHEGLYGNPETIEAKQMLLRNPEVENLGTQVYFGTQKGLELLGKMKLI